MSRLTIAVYRIAVALLLSIATTVLAVPPAVTLRLVAQNLSLPVEMVPANDASGRMFIVEQDGIIRILDSGSVLASPFLDISQSGLVLSGGERGLLGLAFHPQYASNGAFYIHYTRQTDGAIVIARYLRNAVNTNLADASSAAVLLTIPHPVYENHNGGRLAFGPDGFLYIGVGDGGAGNDSEGAGQNLGGRLGKLLRIAVDGGTGYTIPAGNPYGGSTCAAGSCPEIWANGLRNPWKFSFDRTTGDLFIGDVGQSTIEEVNFQAGGAAGGTNYGWGVYEGNNCVNFSYFGMPGACTALAGHTRPIITYTHNGPTGGFSITGGYRYRGTRIPSLVGYYVYGDFVTRRAWAARPDGMGIWVPELIIPTGSIVSSISSFGEDEAGELYVVDYSNGRIFAIDPQPPALLAVQSRKFHGGIARDVLIDRTPPIGGAINIEPRFIGSGHQIVFEFNVTITNPGTVTVTDAATQPVGNAIAVASNNDVRITLTDIPDNQRVTITLTNVNASALGGVASMGFMVGDVNGNFNVNASDISGVKARFSPTVNETNFRFDLNASGAVDATDLTVVKSRSGRTLQ